MILSSGILAIVANIFSTVSIVICNKTLYTTYKLDIAPTLLLTLHQIATGFFAFLSPRSLHKEPPVKKNVLLCLSLSCAAANIFVNLSLKYNSVGTYQLFKMLNVPFVCVGEFVWFGTTHSLGVMVSLMALLCGIHVATVTDVQFNFAGFIFGCLAPVCNAFYSLAVKELTTTRGMSANALLQQTTPYVILSLMPCVFLSDDIFAIRNFVAKDLTFSCVGLVFLSCVLAWCIEYTYIVVLDFTSPLTLQVLGYLKTVLIFFAGFLLFDSKLSLRRFEF